MMRMNYGSITKKNGKWIAYTYICELNTVERGDTSLVEDVRITDLSSVKS